MKRISILLIFVCLNACSSEDVEDMNKDMTGLGVIKTGTFISVGHPTSGTATVSADNRTLTLTSFKTDAGPKLEVWLTTTPTPTTPSTYVNLGALQGEEGNFTYSIPENTNISTFNHVNIWCVDFSVSFGYAKLN